MNVQLSMSTTVRARNTYLKHPILTWVISITTVTIVMMRILFMISSKLSWITGQIGQDRMVSSTMSASMNRSFVMENGIAWEVLMN